MKEESLSEDIRLAIADRYFGWELVELLNIPIEDVVSAFEDNIVEKLREIKEDLGYDEEDNE